MNPTSNPSAFPLNTENTANPGAFDPEPGMTLRDWFAGQALVGAMSGVSAIGDFSPDERKAEASELAVFLFEVADAMLAERAKGGAA